METKDRSGCLIGISRTSIHETSRVRKDTCNPNVVGGEGLEGKRIKSCSKESTVVKITRKRRDVKR